MPIYNAEKYLDISIQSIIKQRFEDYELILINDGSTDTSEFICEKYASQYEKIETISQKNAGVGAARNTGLKAARGKYITFIDADDFIDNDTYLKNLFFLQNHPDIDILQFPTAYYYSPTNIQKLKSSSQIIEGKIEILAYWWEGNIIHFSLWNKIFKKKLFANINFTPGHLSEDTILIVDFSNSAKKIYISNMGCYYYRIHSNSITANYTFKMYIDIFNALFRTYKEIYKYSQFNKIRARAFYRISNKLILAQQVAPSTNLSILYNDLDKYLPNWKDIICAKEGSKLKIWVALIKITKTKRFTKFFLIYRQKICSKRTRSV